MVRLELAQKGGFRERRATRASKEYLREHWLKAKCPVTGLYGICNETSGGILQSKTNELKEAYCNRQCL